MLRSLPLLLAACGAPEPRTFPVTGQVVELRPPSTVVLAHDEVEGFMQPMTMPFEVVPPGVLEHLDPGDRVAGTLVVGEATHLGDLVVVQEAPPPAPRERPPKLEPGQSVPVGSLFPTTPVRLAEGSPIELGVGQKGAVVLTFLYTRCPIPEYCPLVVSRLQALQPQLPADSRIVAVTLDPGFDTPSVLAAFGREHGAEPGRWDFGLVPGEVLVGFAEKAGLRSHGKGLGITHDLLLLVLDADGRVVARYRDMEWSAQEVLAHLGGAP